MPADYGQALEEQIALLRWVERHRGHIESDSLSEGARLALSRTSAQHLEQCEPYYWSPEMCDLLINVGMTIPDWSFDESYLPTPNGFVWFARKIPIESSKSSLQALSWMRRTDGEGLDVVYYASRPVRERGVPIFAIILHRHESIRGDLKRLIFGGRGDSEQIEMSNSRILPLLLIFASALTFMQQQILVAGKRDITDRPTRRRLQREGWTEPPVVRVVELRRRIYVDPKTREEREGPEWSCQWLVRGHWRQQWYPSTGIHAPRWIMPYAKGPLDKPLRASSRIFAVIR